MKRSKLQTLGIGGVISVALVVLTGIVYERVGQYRAALDFPPPGKMVDVGGRRVQLSCQGTGVPTVVFEAGLSIDGSLGWSPVQGRIAAHTRACAYSRPGLMWSDPSDAPPGGSRVAIELHSTLVNAGEHGPFVLVGHSLGGLYVMSFTRYFGSEVVGLVLVDPSHPEQVERVAGFMTESRSMLSRIGVALAWSGILRAAAPAFLPQESHQSARDAQAVRAYAPKSLSTQLAESNSTNRTLAEARGFRELGSRPLVVLTAMAPYTAAELRGMKITPEQGKQVQAIWKQLHEDLATWSSRSRHQVLANSGHRIQFDDPDAVVDAVLSVVGTVRTDWRPDIP